MMLDKNWEEEGMGGDGSNDTKFQLHEINSEDPLHSMVPTVNNTVLCT